MLNHKNFIDKASQILKSGDNDGRIFLFYADITEFQRVNENYGIEKGDCLLMAAMETLGSMPEIAVAERVISDQFLFLVVMKEKTAKNRILAVYEKCAQRFLKEQSANYPACNLRIACGIYPIKTESIVEAIDGANAARKESKRNGSIGAVWYDHSVLARISEYHRKEQKLRLALKEERFTFYLQPKVDLITGKIIGAEALARRVLEDNTVVSPDSFVDVMEKNGSVVGLDLLVYRKVCQYMAERLKDGKPLVRISVNLSRLHIQNPETAELLHSVAQEYGIPADLLEFELTETILLHEFTKAKDLIDQIRGYGYHVSIDDFGAGYAGINIWQDLSFDVLKLDRRFLSEEEPLKTRNEAIVPNVINIAQRLGITVLCEGVESEWQCKYLMRLGCTIVQGFYFSRPVPKEEFFQTYERLDGRYQMPFEGRHQQDVIKEPQSSGHGGYMVLFVTCSMFLLAALIWLIFQIHSSLHYSRELARLMACGSVILLLLFAVVCAVLLFSFRKWRTRLYANEQRYKLLEQFTDIVMFDYDQKNDILRLTPNADKLLLVRGYEQMHFLRNLNDSFVYPGDYAVMEDMLTGKVNRDNNEIRVRFMDPSGSFYFWCLIQFRYVYSGNDLSSVIGKIVDIDIHKR